MKRKDSSFQKLVKKEPFLKGNKEIIEPIDKEIIKNLSIDCRESIAKISNKMKKPYNSIKYRISYMLKRNIIGSFSSMINLSFLHMIVYAIFIKSLDNNKNLLLHLKNHQNSGWVIETKGNYNLI
jgi:DNA-binding Lrp family transcriptional regulator